MQAIHGLAYRPDLHYASAALPPISDSYSEFANGAWATIERRCYRPIGAEPMHSVSSSVADKIQALLTQIIIERRICRNSCQGLIFINQRIMGRHIIRQMLWSRL